MSYPPQFPRFKEIEISDRPVFDRILSAYQPRTSEWTFTNLFIWREYYGIRWSLERDWLLVISQNDADRFAFQPIGPFPRAETTDLLLTWLSDRAPSSVPRIERADLRLVEELRHASKWRIEAQPEHFDYVYRSRDLIELPGRKYHAKRNFVNGFFCSFPAEYLALTPDLVDACRELTDRWCGMLPCEEDLNLKGEWQAARDALTYSQQLGIEGGVLLVDGHVEAYTLGEMLNPDTMVIHIEKGNREIRGIYAAINREFCRNRCAEVEFVDREQDLGDGGLRRAKMSYYPDHMEEKYRIWRR